MSRTQRALGALAAPLRRRSQLGWFALAAGMALLALGVAAWLVRTGVIRAPLWIPVAWLIVAGLVVVGLIRARQGARRLSVRATADWLEHHAGWRRGVVSAQLEPGTAGTSEALRELADARASEQVSRDGEAALQPIAQPIRQRALAGLGALLAGSLLLVSARPWSAPATRVWHPASALLDAAKPVRLRANRLSVPRGDSVTLRIDAPGRASATLYTRAPGDTWLTQVIALDESGHATRNVGPLAADLFARAASGGRGSDTVHVVVQLPAFLGSLSVMAHYPRYLGLADEPLPVSGDSVLLPAGTRLRTVGQATAALSRAAWESDRGESQLDVDGHDFHGEFSPRASGVYTLRLAVEGGAPLAGDTVQLPLRIVADSAPVVTVPVPGADTVAPLSMRLPLVVEARDDHGLTAVRIRIRLGATERLDTVPMGGEPDHAILAHELDLERAGAQPGDTVVYQLVATDNAPPRQVGRSREYRVRIPTKAELREAQREAASAMGSSLDSLARKSAEVQRQTEDLSRERSRAEGNERGPDPALSFEQARQAQALAQATDSLVQQSEQMKDALEALRQAAEQAGLNDPEFQKRLAEVREELAKALTPELRAKLAELKTALQNLDAEQARRALQDLTEAQQKLQQALERSRDLFKRAALEGELANLADEARDLARSQEQWNAAAPKADSARASADEEQMASRADSLASRLQEASRQLDSSAARRALEQASAQAAQAAQQMQQAAQQMQQGGRAQAQQHGRRASQMLGPLAGQMDQARQSAQNQWREEVMQALDQALAETSRLSGQELALSRSLDSDADPATARTAQAALEDGLERVAARIRDIAGKNALVSQQIGVALEVARTHMSASRDAISSANVNLPAAADRAGSAVDALNAAAYMMLRSRDDVAGSASGSGMAEAMEKMSQLAGQQGQLGQQTASLLPMPGQGQGAGQQMMQRLAAQQRAIAQELQRMQAQGNMPGAGQLSQEAQDLARRLEAGRLDRQTVERQQQLFRRMLDAGRTLQGEERDEQKERQSTTAKEGNIHLPPALRERLEQDDTPQLPGWDELQRLSPEDRRLVVDYFRRLAETPQR
ncbi:MAG TPA: DUF4175 family protein [Gemmatimonadales bacterium]|nr:DUF4175 family protein [Gemmatimonadales bacterium]